MREAPKTILSVAFPPDGKADWYVTNPDITFEVSNPIPDARYRTLYRWDGQGEEAEWDGQAIRIPSDGQHILEYRSVATVIDDISVVPCQAASVPRYFSELPRRLLLKLDTTQPCVGSGLTDLFDSRVLITDDFFVNDGSAILTSVMPGRASGSVFLRESGSPPPGVDVLDPDDDGKYILEINAARLVPGTLTVRTAAVELREFADYRADYYESAGRVFVTRLDGGAWPLDEEAFWEIDVRDVVRYENRDGRQRFIVRFESGAESVIVELPVAGEFVDTGFGVVELPSLVLDVTLTNEDGLPLTPGPGTFELADVDGRVALKNNALAPPLSPGSAAKLRVRAIRNQVALERVNFVDDGAAFMLDEGTGRIYSQPSFLLGYDSKAQLLSVERADPAILHDSDIVLELKLESRDKVAKFVDFGTYNLPQAVRGFTISKDQSVWYYARDPCRRPVKESVANIAVKDLESGVDRIFYTFNGEEPTEDSQHIESSSAVLPAPASYQNRFVFKWLAADRAGNSSSGFFTNVGDALTAPLVLPAQFLIKDIARIHFAPLGEVINESSPFIIQSGEFIVIEKDVCRGCVGIDFLVLYEDGSRSSGSTTVCVYNDFLVGSFVPQIVSEFGLGDKDAQARRWYRGFRPIVVLPVFGPRPDSLASETPFPSRIFWKWSDEETYKEYTAPFVLRDIGRNILNIYVSFLDGAGQGTESDALQFSYYWDNERPLIEDNTEPKWLNRDATIFLSPAEIYAGVKAVFFRVWKEADAAPSGATPDAQGLVDLRDVAEFFAERDPDAYGELTIKDLTDGQINEYLRIKNLPPVESMDEWALAGGVENSDVRVGDQREIGGEVFTEINRRISFLQRIESSPFIRLSDRGRYHIAIFAVDNANNVSASDVGVSAEELRPVFAEHVVQIDRSPPTVSLAFNIPAAVTAMADGSQLIELDSYPNIDLVAVDEESGVSAAFYRFAGRNRPRKETVLPTDAVLCEPLLEELPETGEFVRFAGVIKLDASGSQFEDDIFFFATDNAGNRSSVRKATIRVRMADGEADTRPPTIRDIVPKNGKLDVSRNSHIHMFLQDDESGVDIDSVSVRINGVEFRLNSRPAIRLRYTPPATRGDIEFLLVTVVNNNLILLDNFGVHTFLDGTATKEARLSFDDDSFDTLGEVIGFLNSVPGLSADLSMPSLATLGSRLLRDVADVKVYDRSSPVVSSLAQVTLLSLEEESPQFVFAARSKGYVLDVNPRAFFGDAGEILVEVDARDRVGNAMETMQLTFTARDIRTLTSSERNSIYRRSQRFFDRMQANTASDYRKNPFTNQAGFFKAYCHEYAALEREAVAALGNTHFDTVESQHLYRNFGAMMDVVGTQFISQQAYRQLLLAVRDAYLEGSGPVTLRQVLAAWAPGGVEVTDFVDISEDIADQHKIRIVPMFDEALRRHIVTHPDPLKSGFGKFASDFKPAHLGLSLAYGFAEQFDFQAGCEPTCVTEEGFRATRLIIEPTRVTVVARGELDAAGIDRLATLGLVICRVGQLSQRGESSLCPNDAADPRTTVYGFAQRSRLAAIRSDSAVVSAEVQPAGEACPCCGRCDQCDCWGAPEELAGCCVPGKQVAWGPVESIDYSNREYVTGLGRVRVFVEENRHSVARRTYQTIEGCDRLSMYECVDFDELQAGDCVVAMGAFEGNTPVLRDGPWFDLWLTPESYAVIRGCDPELPESIAEFDASGNVAGGYVGVDKSGATRIPPYTDYKRSLLLAAERDAELSQRTMLVPGHTAFREIVDTLKSCPENGCELVSKNSLTAICDCLLVSLQFRLCENLRRDRMEVDGVAKPWHEDVTEQWDGSGVYVLAGSPMLASSEFPGDLRLASKPYEVLAYVDCQLAEIASFDPVRGTVCIAPAPEQTRRVVVNYHANEYASAQSERYHFTVHDDGSMDILERSRLAETGGSLGAERIARDACEPLSEVNQRNEDFFVRSCLEQPNQLQPPAACDEADPFAVHDYNKTRLEPHRLNQDFFLNAFPGAQRATPAHAPVVDHMPFACVEFQEVRIHRSLNDALTATNDPGPRRHGVDFLDGPKLPDLDVDFTELCLCGQYGYYGNIYGELLENMLDRRRRRFGFVDHDTSAIHFAVESAVVPVPGFACYGSDGYGPAYAYFPYYHYFSCPENPSVSEHADTASGGCYTVFQRNPWIAPLFDVREELFWAVEGSDEPFPAGTPVG